MSAETSWTRSENITQNLRPMGFILHVWPEPFLSQHPKILWQCLRNPLLNQQLYFPSVCLTETVPYFPFTFFSWSAHQRYFLLLIMTMSAELPPERAQNISHRTSVPWVLSCLCGRYASWTNTQRYYDNVSGTPSSTNNSTFLQSALPKWSPIFLWLSFHDP